MQGWKLFKHALRMVVGNWRAALHIFLLPSLLLGAVLYVTTGHLSPSEADFYADELFIKNGLVYWFLTALFLLWVVVGWHRFILLKETPQKLLPPFHFNHMIRYAGKALAIFGLSLLIFIPFVVLVVVLVVVLDLSFTNEQSLWHAVLLVVTYFGLRWSLVLPAAAIGRPMKLSQSWAVGNQGVFALLAVAIYGMYSVSFGISEVLTANFGSFGAGISLAIIDQLAWIINVSIVTCLYGHYIEGRSVD
ncbi:hypothetical protein [Shimia sp.]|uniref:hypothetical protein n=1 Tax=Shimia sp. TaxID=1954381 RepID=UPI003B8B82DA